MSRNPSSIPQDALGLQAMPLEVAWTTFEKYKNDDVIQMRPKGILYGLFPGALECQRAKAFPDGASTYFVSKIKLQDGWKLTLRGRFPHARYMSFTVADTLPDGTYGNGQFLNAEMIEPDPGSFNPFREGVNRNISSRNYTIYIIQMNRPAVPQPNTIYVGDDMIGKEIHFPQRIYAVDRGYDGTGVIRLGNSGCGLPIVTLTLPDGTEITGPQLIQLLEAQKNKNDAVFRLTNWKNLVSQSADPISAPAYNPPRPEIFRSTAFSVAGGFMANDPLARVNRYPNTGEGGLLNNPNTKYLTFMFSFNYGEVLVIRGKMPTFPKTTNGERYYQTDTMVKYFSITVGGSPGTGFGYTTVFDEQIPLDCDGYYTIAISYDLSRPENATLDNNVVWIGPGNGEGDYINARNWVGSVYTRFIAPQPASLWPNSPLAVPAPTIEDPILREQEVMGPYYQQCTYMSRAQFEADF